MREQRMRLSRLTALLAVGLLAAGAVGGRAGGASDSSGPPFAGSVRVVFQGSGGGRYVDTFRLVEQGGEKECYAREVADEMVSVSWTASWFGSGFPWPGARAAARSVSGGSVTGSAVRDDCDNPEQADPLWSGSDSCAGPLTEAGPATISVSPSGGRILVTVKAPAFAAPSTPCDLRIRNDQLIAHALVDPAALRTGRSLVVPVGTRRPGPGDAYIPTAVCSDIARRYDGEVWSYDCTDTLIWAGTLTLTRAR
jgi:hypothetical protein